MESSGYAIRDGAEWRELRIGSAIAIEDDSLVSYASMLSWSPQYRTAQGIKSIEETPIPESKISTGSRIVDQDGRPVRVHDLKDAPEPEVMVPATVTMRQARLALLGAGILDDADAAVGAMTGSPGRSTQIEWEYATELRRDHPLVTGLGRGLGLDDAAIDALFVQAVQIA